MDETPEHEPGRTHREAESIAEILATIPDALNEMHKGMAEARPGEGIPLDDLTAA